MSDKKTAFYWASIAGARYEPVEVTKENGKRVARTIGCPDPFFLDAPDCPCALEPNEVYPGEPSEPMSRPEGPFTPRQEARRQRNVERAAKLAKSHRWRGDR